MLGTQNHIVAHAQVLKKGKMILAYFSYRLLFLVITVPNCAGQ